MYHQEQYRREGEIMAKKTTVNIKGMHCRSCELLVEDELSKVKGVNCVCVSQDKGIAEIEHDRDLNATELVNAIRKAGYDLGKDEVPWISRNLKDYQDIGKAALVLFIVFYIAGRLGIFNLAVNSSSGYSSLPVVLLIGLTAGVSTCMALVGGLVLGASARFAEKHPEATSLQKFKPHLFFNLGRIISFFVLGGVIALVGSVFQLSTSVLGILTVAVGGVMLLLGTQLVDISPKLNRIKFMLPKSIAKALGINQRKEQEYSHKGAFVSGALTFFLPCGFTQAMQLYAMSTGNPVIGALTMGTFAIGTAPGLLGVGGLTAIIKGAAAKNFFRFAGLVVASLALFNISNGLRLAGFSLPNLTTAVKANETDPNVTIENGVQVVRMNQEIDGYEPSNFVVKKGIPVKWIITSKNITTCASAITFPKFNIRAGLQLGENVFEFTPTEIGTFRFSCLMGMFNGSFTVTDGSTTVTQAAAAAAPIPNQKAGSCGSGGGGCGCGSGAKNATTTLGPQATPEPSANVQIIKASYDPNTDITPNSFKVRAGKPVRFEIAARDDGIGCMGSITIPKLTQNVEVFSKGQTTIFEFTPTAGTYPITCGMGIPRGQIVVE